MPIYIHFALNASMGWGERIPRFIKTMLAKKMTRMTKLGVWEAFASFLVTCQFEIDRLFKKKQDWFPIIKIQVLAKWGFYRLPLNDALIKGEDW